MRVLPGLNSVYTIQSERPGETMDQKTWLWRKKSTEKNVVAADKVNVSLKINEEEVFQARLITIFLFLFVCTITPAKLICDDLLWIGPFINFMNCDFNSYNIFF